MSPATESALEIRRWQGIEALEREAQRAESLFRAADLDPLCNSASWLVAHARAFVDPADLFGWTVERGEEVVGFLPLRLEPARGRFALRRALLSSDGTFDSDYLDVALAPGEEREVGRLLVDALASERRLQAVVLSGVPDASRFLPVLRDELARRRLPARERPGDCLAAPLPETLDDFVGGLKSRMRSKVRQARRRAEEAGATLAWCTDETRLEEHLEGLFDLHGQRWSEVGENGSFAEEPRRALYHELLGIHGPRDELRFSRLDLEGRPIAYQFGLRRGDTYYQLQEGYDPAVESFRSATALRVLSIGALIDEGVTSYDYMAGATRHKRDWGGVDRPCTTVAFALPRLRARISYGLRAWQDRRASAES